MGTKMKGVLKGFRYITHIFEDKKEPEMQIGLPTDVKHVAHIGLDGSTQSVDNSPSWIKEFKTTEGTQTAKDKAKKSELDRNKDSSDQRGLKLQNNPTPSLPDMPKSSKRNSLVDSSPTSACPRESSKSRQSRRNPSDSCKSTRKQKDSCPGSNSTCQIPPKKSSRKKAKEKVTGVVHTISRVKGTPPPADSYSSPYSDPGPDIHDIRTACDRNSFLQSSSLMKLGIKEEEKR